MSQSFVVDRFSLFFKFLILGSVGLVVIASQEYVGKFQNYVGEYFSLILLSAVGMLVLVSSMELITLYIALELSALPLVALSAFLGDSKSSEAGLKFLLLAALSSAVLLYGLVLIFGVTGTTHLGLISSQIAGGSGGIGSPIYLFGITLLVAGFGFKIAAVPFQMWVPDVYEGAPTPITAFLSVASKAAGFAVILRVFYGGLFDLALDWGVLFGVLSAISMTIGNLVAISQVNIKRMLAYSTIAHAGYMMIGLATASSSSLGEGMIFGPSTILFYLGGYALTNLAAFIAIIAVTNRTGNEEIQGFWGIGRRAPFEAFVLAVSLVSLTGIPPTVGFMAKLFIFSSAINSGLIWLVALGLINSVVSAYYYLRIVRGMYLSSSEQQESLSAPFWTRVALAVTTFGVLLMGIWPQGLMALADKAVLGLIP
jgi:NADH-quinone oxidoreductase subunit N